LKKETPKDEKADLKMKGKLQSKVRSAPDLLGKSGFVGNVTVVIKALVANGSKLNAGVAELDRK